MAESKLTTQTNVVTPARVTFLDGQNDLSMLEVNTRWSNAEIYSHGAQVTQFRLKNEPPLLFMSQFSRFAEGQPIRGGIPVIFPWFGLREGLGQHGFARLKEWDLKEIIPRSRRQRQSALSPAGMPGGRDHCPRSRRIILSTVGEGLSRAN